MNRLERLLNLVAALLDASVPLTRQDLTERVPGYEGEPDAVRRAFERDKDTLRAMGIPITLEPIDPAFPEWGEGYRIRREQYELPDLDLSTDELAALHMAASTVRLEGATTDEAMWKLGGTPGDAREAAAPVAIPGAEHLPRLFQAVMDRRRVTFRYRGSDRDVEPYHLACRNGRWYVTGLDRTRGDERQFRLDRFESAPALGEPGAFARPTAAREAPLHPWEMGEGDPLDARVLVDAEQAAWVVAKVGEAAVAERRPTGAVVLALAVTNVDAFRSFVLGFLDHAEVLAPEELRADVVGWLEALVR